MKAKAIILVVIMLVGMSSIAIAKNPAEPAAAPSLNNTITGVVLDKTTGESLTGVEVRMEGTDLKTYTDFDGKFVFENVKAGEYKLMANYISYDNSETKPIKVNSNELHALNLQMETLDK
jgi:hypothetical protein